MSDSKQELKLPILEPLTGYFLAASQDDGPYGSLAKMYYSCECYKDNEGAENDDISYEFMSGLKNVAETFRKIDPSTKKGTIRELFTKEKINKLYDYYIKNKILPENFDNSNEVSYKTIIDKMFENSGFSYDDNNKLQLTESQKQQISLKSDFSRAVTNYIFEKLKEEVDKLTINNEKMTNCYNILKNNMNIQNVVAIDNNIMKQYFANNKLQDITLNKLKYILGLVKTDITSQIFTRINDELFKCYEFGYVSIKESQIAMDTIEMLNNRNTPDNVKDLFSKYFSIINIKSGKYNNNFNEVLTQSNEYRIDIKKDKDGSKVLIFNKLLPTLYLGSKIFLNQNTFIDEIPEVVTNNILVNKNINNKEDTLMSSRNNMVKEIADNIYYGKPDYQEEIKKITASDAILDISKCTETLKSFKSSSSRNRNNTEDTDSEAEAEEDEPMNSGPVDYKKVNELIKKYITTPNKRFEFVRAWKSDGDELSEIEAGMAFNGWKYDKRKGIYQKKIDGEYVNIDKNYLIADETCDAFGEPDDINKCVAILEKAASGDYAKVVQLLKDNDFVNAIKKQNLNNIPPIIALNFLKGLGFKKRSLLVGRNRVIVIEPVANWVERISSKKPELAELLKNKDNNVLKLIQYMKTIVHMNPTVLGNDPSVVLEKESVIPAAKDVDVDELGYTVSLEEIMKRLDTPAARKFYQGLSDPRTIALNSNPAIQLFMTMLPRNISRGIFKGGSLSEGAGEDFYNDNNLKSHLSFSNDENIFDDNFEIKSSPVTDVKKISLNRESDNFQQILNKIKTKLEKLEKLNLPEDESKAILNELEHLTESIVRFAELETELFVKLDHITKVLKLRELGWDPEKDGDSNESPLLNMNNYNNLLNKLSKKHMKVNLLVNDILTKLEKKKTNLRFPMSNL
jgi:hypothetical protein